jgi:hypothetical protein
MAHAQKPDFVLRWNGRVHSNWRGRQFSRLLAGELSTSACRVCTARASLCSAVMWRLLATHSILLFTLHFSSRSSPCAITFQLDSTSPLFLKRKDRNSVDYIPPLDLILSLSNPVYELTLYFFNICFNIILPRPGFLRSLFSSDLFFLASIITLNRADVPKEATIKNIVLCDMTSCSPVSIYFPSTLKMEAVGSLGTLTF